MSIHHTSKTGRMRLLLVGALSLAVVPPAIAVSAPRPSAHAQPTLEVAEPERARVPIYRDPPSYVGRKRAPRTAAPNPPPKVTLTSVGDHPDVHVDEAGTGHIVWNEGRGDAADVAVYCRLKRAATGCDSRSELVWNKTYGSGDGPRFNIDDQGPRIVRVGEQLLVLSYRYPTLGEKPDGASSRTVVGWVSNDGGTTWSEARILGKRSLGQLAVVGPDDDPTIANLAHDALCGGTCLSLYRSGTYVTEEGVLNPVADANYSPSLVSTEGTYLAAMANSGVGGSHGDPWRLWLRRWNGAEPVTDPSNWTTSPPIAGDEPELAAGPSGAFLMHRRWRPEGFVGALQVRPVTGVAPGAPVTISGESGRLGVLEQDASGGLHAAYIESTTNGGVVRFRSSDRGTVFDASYTLMKAPAAGAGSNGQLDVSAAKDGGGFVVLNHTGGVVDDGRIVAAAVGSQAPTGLTGLGDLPGGGNISCKKVGFGAFDIKTVEGCFFKGTGDNRHLVVTRGAVTLNGLEIVPLPGDKLVIDAQKLRIDTIGRARVLIREGDAEVELFRGQIHVDLSAVRPGTRLFEFPREEYQANVLGFPAASGIPVELTAGGVRIPVELKLPSEFGGFTARAVLIGRTGQGLVLDSLDVRVGPVPLGVLTVNRVEVHWQQGGTWTGEGDLTLPVGGSIEAAVRFEAGDFAEASLGYRPDPPVTIGPFVYLTRVGGGFAVRPDVKITASAEIGAGAPVQGLHPVKADGTFTMTFPRSGPGVFRLDGGVRLFGIEISNGYVLFRTNGYARFHGESQLSLGPLSGGVTIDGFVDGTGGHYGADFSAGAQYCTVVKDPAGQRPDQQVCSGSGVNATVSSIGLAACATIDPPIGPTFSSGLAARWDELSPEILAHPLLLTAELITSIKIDCNTAEYRIPQPPARPAPARVARAGGRAFAIPGGLRSATLLVRGDGGVPDVVVTGPDGRVLVGPGATSSGIGLVGVPGADAVWVTIAAPPAGDYQVAPAAGSVPIMPVLVGNGFRPARVKGDVERGRIDYRVAGLTPGQAVVFRETGAFGRNILGSTAKPKGMFRFRPAKGPGGRRTVEALVTQGGLPVRVVRLGQYRAPPPMPPGPVRKLKAVKKGSKLIVTYRAPRAAARVTVRVRGSAGARIVRSMPRSKRRVVFDGLRWDRRIKVAVQGVSGDGLQGPRRRVVIRGR